MKGGTVLVVEDDVDVRESLRDVLESEGYEVVEAGNGRDALERLHAIERPNVILLDLMMPVMSGEEFLLALRAIKEDGLADIPVVILSAWPQDARELPSQGFVKKPIVLEKLLEAVARYVA